METTCEILSRRRRPLRAHICAVVAMSSRADYGPSCSSATPYPETKLAPWQIKIATSATGEAAPLLSQTLSPLFSPHFQTRHFVLFFLHNSRHFSSRFSAFYTLSQHRPQNTLLNLRYLLFDTSLYTLPHHVLRRWIRRRRSRWRPRLLKRVR
jgi:hypothetical protein